MVEKCVDPDHTLLSDFTLSAEKVYYLHISCLGTDRRKKGLDDHTIFFFFTVKPV